LGDGLGHLKASGGPAHVVGAGFAFLDDRSDGAFERSGFGGFAEPIQHHLGCEDGGDGVDLVLAGVFGRGTMGGFEHGKLRADVAGAAEAEAADHLGTEVGDDIAVEVGSDEDIVVKGVLEQPHGQGVNVRLVQLDLRKILRHGSGGL